MRIHEALARRRGKTDEHIRQLERQGRAGRRYTAMLPNIPFLILGLLCDAGWILHLVAGWRFLSCSFNLPLLLSMLAVAVGVGMTIRPNLIHEKEIALGYQKDLSFGLTVAAGLAGGIVGLIINDGWIAAGGFLNFASGLPIYLSFKPGIHYGVQ
ncbi:MAG: hypothetical protein IJ662_05410 [Clostridia bacterium]|nr:hypothetical protein [Clostridia bacterium]